MTVTHKQQELITPYERLVNLKLPAGKRRSQELCCLSSTGIDDPYEPPLSAELVLDSVTRSAEDNAELTLTLVSTGKHTTRSTRSLPPVLTDNR
jgi:hypothetical protein